MKKQVSDKIRKLREEKGMSQENVADELGITHSSYSKIERGETDPNITRLYEIAKILGVGVSDFFISDLVTAFKEPKESYGNISKTDLEKLNQSIQKLHSEISSLRADISGKELPLKLKRAPKR